MKYHNQTTKDPIYDTLIPPNASLSLSFSSKEQPSYGAADASPVAQSNSYDLSLSSGSTNDLDINPPRPNGKTQQSMNPPPLPPSRRRALSNDLYLQRSNSGDYELETPRSSGSGYNAAPPKAPPRQLSPRHTYNGPGSLAGVSVNSSTNHRRNHTFDVSRKLRRASTSSNSLVSLNSQGSNYSQRSISESLKLLPDPRWGGGSGGRSNRARTMSNEGGERGHRKLDSISSHDGLLFNSRGRGQHYGSVASPKDVIITSGLNIEQHVGGRHRRTPSEVSAVSHTSAVSVDTSIEPARVDPAKSSMFKEIASGIVRQQLPKDNFRMLSDRDLEYGHVYKRQLVPNEAEFFQDFHIVEEGNIPLQTLSGCSCLCDNCAHCHSRRKTLPPTYYVMSVKSDIYRRMFDEVSESKNMPCGLFFCGHHEDVRYPDIRIAVLLVSILFAGLLAATIYFKD